MVTRKTPYLVLCKKCKRHGHFSLPDGEISIEFYTVESALDVIKRLHRTRMLSGSEASMLESQVKSSGIEPFDYFFIDVLARYHSLLDEMEEVPEDEKEIMDFLVEHHSFKQGSCVLNNPEED